MKVGHAEAVVLYCLHVCPPHVQTVARAVDAEGQIAVVWAQVKSHVWSAVASHVVAWAHVLYAVAWVHVPHTAAQAHTQGAAE